MKFKMHIKLKMSKYRVKKDQEIIDEISRLLGLYTKERALYKFFKAENIAEAIKELNIQDLGLAIVDYLFNGSRIPEDDESIKILLYLSDNNWFDNKWFVYRDIIKKLDIKILENLLKNKTLVLNHDDKKLKKVIYDNIICMNSSKRDRQNLLISYIEDKEYMMLYTLYNHYPKISYLIDCGYELVVPDIMMLYILVTEDIRIFNELHELNYDFSKKIFENKTASEINSYMFDHQNDIFNYYREIGKIVRTRSKNTTFDEETATKLNNMIEKINAVDEDSCIDLYHYYI